ncbi:MAZ isoform 14 [Pan troglodytes]|uniref:MYC associated zinc finger protein n=4 Tax=Homininae TaxID=207598 RepID=I3L411_HUMAN|nr:MYC associated zinc finger protein [Homo sapiens]KAI4054381.1 MYC associated zinc finger protein [Homo sapiens]PNI13491.1 MAZ isoform 14 [Pan troglodytes]
MLSSAYISDHMKVHSQGPHHVCELCNKGTCRGLPGGPGAEGGRLARRLATDTG